VNVARTAVKICGSRTKTDYEAVASSTPRYSQKKRALSKRRKQRYQRFKNNPAASGNSLPFAGLFVNSSKLARPCADVSPPPKRPCFARRDVISALGLHLRGEARTRTNADPTARVSGFKKKSLHGEWRGILLRNRGELPRGSMRT